MLFWGLAAVLVALALVFVLPPLVRGRTRASTDAQALNVTLVRERLAELEREAEQGALDPGQLDSARAELERELLADVQRQEPAHRDRRRELVTPALVGVVVPLFALGLYFSLGDRQALEGVPLAPSAAGGGEALPSVDEMVARLESRLQREPGDPTGWLMLARSYMFMQRWDEAESAFARAFALGPEDPDVMIEYAASLGRRAEGNLQGRPAALLERALQAQPEHANGLFLLGHVRLQQQDYAGAITLWQRVAAQLDPASEDMRQLQSYIAEARQALGQPAAPLAAAGSMPATPDAAAGAGAAGKSITVRVQLDPGLESAAAQGDTLFVYARAADGPRMPLAIARRQVSELPLTLTLDDSMAMAPQMTLSRFAAVTVEARISKSGNAMPQSGDLRGTRSPVIPGSTELVQVTIDSRVP